LSCARKEVNWKQFRDLEDMSAHLWRPSPELPCFPSCPKPDAQAFPLILWATWGGLLIYQIGEVELHFPELLSLCVSSWCERS
jgi:hypothetical protein